MPQPSRDVVVAALADLFVRERYQARYLPGQQLYRRDAAPHEHAHILIDHEDPPAPRVLRWPTADS